MGNIDCVYDTSIAGNGYVFYEKEGHRGVKKLIKLCIDPFSQDLQYLIIAKDNDFDLEAGKVKTVELIINPDSEIYSPFENLYSKLPKLPDSNNKILYSSPFSEESVELNIIDGNIILKATREVHNPKFLGNAHFSITLRNTPYLVYLEEFYGELRELDLSCEYFFPKMHVKTNY